MLELFWSGILVIFSGLCVWLFVKGNQSSEKGWLASAATISSMLAVMLAWEEMGGFEFFHWLEKSLPEAGTGIAFVSALSICALCFILLSGIIVFAFGEIFSLLTKGEHFL